MSEPRDHTPEILLAMDIVAELSRARAKFPGDNVTMLALMEEVGELAKATFEEDRAAVRKEAVQVACMAMRVVLDGDATLNGWRAAKGLDPLTADPRGAPMEDGMTRSPDDMIRLIEAAFCDAEGRRLSTRTAHRIAAELVGDGYLRADLSVAAVEAARAEALREAAGEVLGWQGRVPMGHPHANAAHDVALARIHDAILALIPQPAPDRYAEGFRAGVEAALAIPTIAEGGCECTPTAAIRALAVQEPNHAE